MQRTSLKPVIQHLHEWRVGVIGRLRDEQERDLMLKPALDVASRWLEVHEQHQVPASGATEVAVLPLPESYHPLGDYRILWDAETEDRSCWREVARALPGDLLVRVR